MSKSRLLTKSGHLAIIHPTMGGLVVAGGDGKFSLGFPFCLKNDGDTDVTLSVRLASQVGSETYPLTLWAKSRFCDELIMEIVDDIPETHTILWGA